MPVYKSKTKNPAIAGLLKYSDRAVKPLQQRLLCVDDANKLPVFRALFLKLDVPVFFCEQRMVAAKTNIGAGMKTGATLTNDNITRNDFFAAIDLDA